MKFPRRRTLPLVLAHAAAAGVLAATSCDSSVASFAVQRTTETEQDAQQLDKPVLPNGDAMRGETLYAAKCGACHSIDQNRIGPKHRGVFGRNVGGVDDYEYSAALSDADLVWDDASLDEWLRAPTKMFPGTRMGFAVGDDQERADIIAYLQSVSD